MRLYCFFGLHAMRFFVQHYAPKQLQSLIKYPQQVFVHLAHPFAVFSIKFGGKFLGTKLDMLPLKNEFLARKTT